MMEKTALFADFDDETIYNQSQLRAQEESTRNFVVEFGQSKAHIAFDLGVGDLQTLLEFERQHETPVRWINVWSPNRQTEIIELLGKRYKFSPRLLAIIKEIPPDRTYDVHHKNDSKYKAHRKDDVETATSSIGSATALFPSHSRQIIRQYDVAKQWINLQSIDVGTHFTCIGANWMHELPHLREDASLVDEGSQRRLWSWLILCDDSTVISIHEDPGPVNDVEDFKSLRGNTLSVLSQLSMLGHLSSDPTSMQSVRQTLEADANPGIEGASNLFYYLFDDWRAVYNTIAAFRVRLEKLQNDILIDMTRKSHKPPNIEIIPRLHFLGAQVRQMQGLYEGYRNLIQRIMEPKHTTIQDLTTQRSFSGLSSGTSVRGVVLAQSASLRFERLGDRIQLLILSGTKEFLAEKEALISMYFNINTQKDSEATARLTRSATLLAKLSVLFLPVSLMTSYFSVQISDIQGVYTIKEYWIVFAVIMSISFMGLFFFSRLLMWVTETLDEWIKRFNMALAGLFRRRRNEHED